MTEETDGLDESCPYIYIGQAGPPVLLWARCIVPLHLNT